MLIAVSPSCRSPLTPPRRHRPAVYFYQASGPGGQPNHDACAKARVAESLARLLDLDYAGELDVDQPLSRPAYLVPRDTLLSLAEARRLGVRHAGDLFGGVVPAPFVATKVVSHPLIGPGAAAPIGWSVLCAQRIQGASLPGFSVFSMADAREACSRLLAGGSVRLKDPCGVGGLGQWVIREPAELEEHLARMGEASLACHGLVLERNLHQVTTFSVGQVQAGSHRAAYFGTQELTRCREGREVYGGSTLIVSRGDFDSLLRQDLAPPVRQAVSQALAYHRAIVDGYPALIASRCNYDVAHGLDDAGRVHCGVLEQSWRIGGASGAEVAALHALAADPSITRVRASTCEVHADDVTLPPGAWLTYDGPDNLGRRLVKFVQVSTDVDA